MPRAKRSYRTSLGHDCDSRFERDVLQDLIDRGVSFEYEPQTYPYRSSVVGGVCDECGSDQVTQERSYTPDIRLPSGILVEVKGYFSPQKRHLLRQFVKQNGGLDVRFVFQADRYLTKQKKTRLSQWAERAKCEWAIGRVPKEWC